MSPAHDPDCPAVDGGGCYCRELAAAPVYKRGRTPILFLAQSLLFAATIYVGAFAWSLS